MPLTASSPCSATSLAYSSCVRVTKSLYLYFLFFSAAAFSFSVRGGGVSSGGVSVNIGNVGASTTSTAFFASSFGGSTESIFALVAFPPFSPASLRFALISSPRIICLLKRAPSSRQAHNPASMRVSITPSSFIARRRFISLLEYKSPLGFSNTPRSTLPHIRHNRSIQSDLISGDSPLTPGMDNHARVSKGISGICRLRAMRFD